MASTDLAEYYKEVILRVTEFKVATNYGKASLVTQPTGDIFYRVELSKEHTEDGLLEGQPIKVLNVAGIRHIIKELTVALMVDANREDF